MLTLRLERYTLVEEIHRGPHSTTYRGVRDADGQPILAKLLFDEYPSPTQLAQLRHAHALAHELEIPGVATGMQLEQHGHGLALIWADRGGVVLRELLRAGPLGCARALAIAASLADTLAAVHERRIIHNDLNPANVLVDPDTGTTELIGFGRAARLAREPGQRAGLAALEGALAYVSPEQTGRMNRIVDRRSDLYSLGVLLYELLTGAPPFVSDDLSELVHGHLVRPPVAPHERVAELPRQVSELVLKLLAKNAEDRYQHARALADDLRECSARLARGAATIEPFELATGDHDPGDELDVPQRLCGREAELAALLRAWERVAGGAVELLLVRGYSGVGKSVLVHELLRELSGARAYFVSGKFDQLARAVPYAALTAALAELVHLLLTEPEAELARVRERLLAALGDDAGVLTELLGDLGRILGDPPPPSELGAAASRRRFVRASPLVMFLDDLQWADLASLELLTASLDGAAGQLLSIGAYRSNEVDADHPLMATLRELDDAQHSTIELGPLARADVLRLVADTLALPVDEAAPLARLVHAKTDGNPLFLTQLLVALHRDGALRYDRSARAYTWDAQRVRATAASDNVVEFMTEQIGRLPSATCRALELAACVGHRFELGTLALVAERPVEALIGELWPALERGVIVALVAEYRFSPAALADGLESADVEFRFVHDRVQQAAYARIAADQRAALHLRIGRLLRSRRASGSSSPSSRPSPSARAPGSGSRWCSAWSSNAGAGSTSAASPGAGPASRSSCRCPPSPSSRSLADFELDRFEALAGQEPGREPERGRELGVEALLRGDHAGRDGVAPGHVEHVDGQGVAAAVGEAGPLAAVELRVREVEAREDQRAARIVDLDHRGELARAPAQLGGVADEGRRALERELDRLGRRVDDGDEVLAGELTGELLVVELEGHAVALAGHPEELGVLGARRPVAALAGRRERDDRPVGHAQLDLRRAVGPARLPVLGRDQQELGDDLPVGLDHDRGDGLDRRLGGQPVERTVALGGDQQGQRRDTQCEVAQGRGAAGRVAWGGFARAHDRVLFKPPSNRPRPGKADLNQHLS